MDIRVISFDGNAVNGATSYRVYVPAGVTVDRIITTVESQRRNTFGTYDGMHVGPLEFTLRISNNGYATSYETFKSNVNQWFHPYKSVTRELIAIFEDAAQTEVSLDVVVLSLKKMQDAGSVSSLQFEARVRATYPVWRSTTSTVSASNPATVTNNGNAPTLPSVALTTATHKTLRRCTVTGAGAAGGVTGYPILFDLDDTAATNTNVFVYVEGVSVPCYVVDSGLVTSEVIALIDTHPDGTTATNVDIVYGAGLVNPLCQKLDDGGMEWTHSSFTNTNWRWDDWRVSSMPARTGSWRLGRTGRHQSGSFQLDSDSSGSVVFSIEGWSDSNPKRNDFDSIVVNLGVPAGTSSALSALDRTTTGMDGTNSRAFVRYRIANSASWQTAWSTRANGTVTTSIDLDNAVEIAAGIENDGGSSDGSTLTLEGGAGVSSASLALAAAGANGTPTVVVGSAANLDFYDGAYTIGAYTITFNDFMVEDGTLTIDCHNRTISSSVSGAAMFGGEDAITFSDPDNWLVLLPGSNTVTDGLSATDTITSRDGWS